LASTVLARRRFPEDDAGDPSSTTQMKVFLTITVADIAKARGASMK
jgi:hypothetical protein